jgi:hypothetical protein
MNTENNRYLRKLGIRLGVVVVLLLAMLLIKPLVLNGGKVVRLQPAALLTGQIAQSLGSMSSLPIPGKDFQLQDVTYFENKQWAYVHIQPTGPNTQDSFAILHQKDGIYTVVLGPGTAFSSDTTNNLPDSVGLFLIHKGMVYDSTN